MTVLHEQILALHRELAERDCASTQIIKASAALGKSLTDSIAAGMLMLGEFHAPVEQTLRFWSSWRQNTSPDWIGWDVWRNLFPGFGSSWYKAEPDPAFGPIRELLSDEIIAKLDHLTAEIHSRTGKIIYPNAAMYTAIVADELDYTPEFASSLLVRGRMDTWCLIWAQNYRSFN